MTYQYRTKGTCSSMILIDLADDHTLTDVKFVGGCQGNLSGISALVKGMKAEDIIKKLRGTNCGPRRTSCPDQLAIALEEALNKA
ncbi:MAG: TIGR03905 family TSCPD domain-containing protein [Oscillospiraceae bacterium]|nr:TIGR03905 family TSCPD domain-containing protein [Oscillospiraceae bacterium]